MVLAAIAAISLGMSMGSAFAQSYAHELPHQNQVLPRD
jgi:hypothetical protein